MIPHLERSINLTKGIGFDIGTVLPEFEIEIIVDLVQRPKKSKRTKRSKSL